MAHIRMMRPGGRKEVKMRYDVWNWTAYGPTYGKVWAVFMALVILGMAYVIAGGILVYFRSGDAKREFAARLRNLKKLQKAVFSKKRKRKDGKQV